MDGGAGGRSKKSFVEFWKNDLIYHPINSYKVDNKKSNHYLDKESHFQRNHRYRCNYTNPRCWYILLSRGIYSGPDLYIHQSLFLYTGK